MNLVWWAPTASQWRGGLAHHNMARHIHTARTSARARARHAHAHAMFMPYAMHMPCTCDKLQAEFLDDAGSGDEGVRRHDLDRCLLPAHLSHLVHGEAVHVFPKSEAVVRARLCAGRGIRTACAYGRSCPCPCRCTCRCVCLPRCGHGYVRAWMRPCTGTRQAHVHVVIAVGDARRHT